MRRLVLLLALSSGLLAAPYADAAELDRALAIADPATLRALDSSAPADAAGHPGFALGRMLGAAGDRPIDNQTLFTLPAMAPVRGAIDQAFDSYAHRHAVAPGATPDTGDSFDAQLFDRALLFSAQTRFALAGIVNRMDRADRAPDSCGEVRLIYRLRRTDVTSSTAEPSSPLLPMTLNLVLRAARAEGSDVAPRCAAAAQRWFAAAESPSSGAEFARRLRAADGPLAALTPDAIDRIEINLQIAHAPQGPDRGPRTDYLLASFRYHAGSGRFEPALLENQVDRDRLLADLALAQAFKSWLLTPSQLAALDRGTLTIPDDYLAREVIATTPAGFAPSPRQPSFGLVPPGEGGPVLFNDAEIVAALRAAAEGGIAFTTIRSPAGFARRLDDVSCAGCHQVRGIGGFHFPGVDHSAETISRVAASPHFIDEQARRRGILVTLSEGRAPDYSRGFADRALRRDADQQSNARGWGAHCGRADARGAVDASFAAWRCDNGLSCEAVGEGGAAAPIGMCFVARR